MLTVTLITKTNPVAMSALLIVSSIGVLGSCVWYQMEALELIRSSIIVSQDAQAGLWD